MYVKTYSQKETDDQLFYIKEMLLNGENDIPIKMDIESYIVFNETHLHEVHKKLKTINSEIKQITSANNVKIESDNILDKVDIDIDNVEESEIVTSEEYLEKDMDIAVTGSEIEANNLGWD